MRIKFIVKNKTKFLNLVLVFCCFFLNVFLVKKRFTPFSKPTLKTEKIFSGFLPHLLNGAYQFHGTGYSVESVV